MSVRLLKSLVVLSVAAVATVSWWGLPDSQAANEKETGPMYAHMVFFELKEPNQANADKLVAACHKYLSDMPGAIYYSAGTRAKEADRPVNDTKFDVALHVVFKDQASHDQYQTAPQHLKFIEQNKELWSGVRVFDSFVTAP